MNKKFWGKLAIDLIDVLPESGGSGIVASESPIDSIDVLPESGGSGIVASESPIDSIDILPESDPIGIPFMVAMRFADITVSGTSLRLGLSTKKHEKPLIDEEKPIVKKIRRKTKAIGDYKVGDYMYVIQPTHTWFDCMKSSLFKLLNTGIHRYKITKIDGVSEDGKAGSRKIHCADDNGFVVIVKIAGKVMTVTNTQGTCARLTSQEEVDYEVELQLYERLTKLLRKLESIRLSIENATNEGMNKRLVEKLEDFENLLDSII